MTEAAALHTDDELFAEHIEPGRRSRDPVEWTVAEESDNDNAPAPPERELIDMPPAPASAPPMSNLERCIALRLVYGAGPRRVSQKSATCIISASLSLCCLTCRLSRVFRPRLCFHVLTTSPRLPHSDRQKRVFRNTDQGVQHVCKFLRSFSRHGETCERVSWECHPSGTHGDKRSCGSLVKAPASARVDVPTAPIFLWYGARSPRRVNKFYSR